MKSRLIGAVCACSFALLASTSEAAAITYTGSDLFNDPAVTFPTLTPTVSDTALVFGTGAAPHSKLLVLPLFPAGTLPTDSPTTVSVSINFTRLACDTSVGCAEGSVDDSDHHFALGDGSNLVSGAASDGLGGAGTVREYSDLGSSAGLDSTLIVFTDAGYPAIGSSFDVNSVFTLDSTTTIDLSFLGGSATTTGLQGLNRASGVDFVFLSESDPGEQYRINSLTISSPALVPIPPALWLFGSGLLGLVGIARRKAA